MISAFRRRASSIAWAVLPEPVGPVRTSAFWNGGGSMQATRVGRCGGRIVMLTGRSDSRNRGITHGRRPHAAACHDADTRAAGGRNLRLLHEADQPAQARPARPAPGITRGAGGVAARLPAGLERP